jgi:hypothetical protein
LTVAPEEEWTDFKAQLDLATANGTGGRLVRQPSTIWLCWSERHTSPSRSNCGCSPTHLIRLECEVVELEEGTAAACERAIERVSARELSVLVVSTATLDFLSNERPDFMDSLAAVFGCSFCSTLFIFMMSRFEDFTKEDLS